MSRKKTAPMPTRNDLAAPPAPPPATAEERQREAATRMQAVIDAIRTELRVEVGAEIVPLTDVAGGFRPVIRIAAIPE
jgi:hypothetical protein